MELYRDKNIEALMSAIELDEFDDSAQRENCNVQVTPHFDFVARNLIGQNVLEVGCGNGDLFFKLPISHAIEPSTSRFKTAKVAADARGVEIAQACLECLPDDFHGFDSIFFLDGFFQTRSEYECLIEVNRALRVGGRFIFTFISSDDVDIVVGKVWAKNNIIRILRDFGFTFVVECREFNCNYERFPKPIKYVQVCVEKTHNFDPAWLRKLFISKGEGKNATIGNVSFTRDYPLL